MDWDHVIFKSVYDALTPAVDSASSTMCACTGVESLYTFANRPCDDDISGSAGGGG